jgi:DNA-binding NarL/FixJ family response regulator
MRLGPLTKRETEIVLLMAEGHRRESIANQLDVKSYTVTQHMKNILRKLNVNSAIEVVVWYYKGWWEPK